MRWLEKEYDNMDFSFIRLRQLIGVLGLLLPLILIIGNSIIPEISIQRSISHYYHTNMRDFFVGLLFLIGLFLITYKGYNRLDNFISSLSGVAAMGIAIFPCLFQNPEELMGILQIRNGLTDIIHFICASLFFTLLAFNSIFLFTKCNNGDKTRHKKIRNIVYIICGLVIVISLIILALILLIGKVDTGQTITVLVFETIMLFAFGVSWLVKGETILKDK